MPRKCTICGHKSRAKIDQALVERQPFRNIAAQFRVSTSALVRHSDDHLPAALVKAHDAREAADADALLARVVDYQNRAIAILEKAEAVDDFRSAISALREARGCTELLGKLAGQLRDAPTIIGVQGIQILRIRLPVWMPSVLAPEDRSIPRTHPYWVTIGYARISNGQMDFS